MTDPVAVYHALKELIARSKVQYYVKHSQVYSRTVPSGYVNTARFGEFVESHRAALVGEVLCMNPVGGETWFTDGDMLHQKTVAMGVVVVDGVAWEVREPNDHPSNRIGAVPYMGEFGDNVEFYKPVWGTMMRIAVGGWIAINLNNTDDIWAIEKRAMNQLYRQVEE